MAKSETEIGKKLINLAKAIDKMIAEAQKNLKEVVEAAEELKKTKKEE